METCLYVGFDEQSRERHRRHYEPYRAGGDQAEKGQAWLADDTVYAWRQGHKYACLDPILDSKPKNKWLTVGDGRFGQDAKYILNRGDDALPTDITTQLLEEAYEDDRIPDYAREDAADLSFEDSSFDYVLCKETLHHIPRPYQALYEMLRVADEGVVLIEPNDPEISESALTRMAEGAIRGVKLVFDRASGSGDSVPFEKSGNYVFRISRREIVKTALALNYETVAFRGINDFAFHGDEFEALSENGPLQEKIRQKIRISDWLCRLNLLDHGLLVAAVFETEPSTPMRRALESDGYDVRELPENPYLE